VLLALHAPCIIFKRICSNQQKYVKNKNRTYPIKFLQFQRRGAIFTTSKVQRLESTKKTILVFDVLLTVHLSIFILVINELHAQNLFYNKFISCLYMFRAHVLETCRGIK